MSVFAEFHVVQNFAPANLNRDDTGAPKDAMFGGVRRARISSQCFKRAVRLHAAMQSAASKDDLGIRTKKLRALLAERLEKLGRPDATAQIGAALEAAGLQLDADGHSQYLLFLGQREVDALAALVHQHWEELTPAQAAQEKAKRSKKEAKAEAPDEVRKAAKKLLDGGKAIDVGLFGRMLADLPEANREAACQVAHAISTHRVDREFDYFTAVDDLGGEGETGAGMIGTVEFNSATFYRYAVLDVEHLLRNLGGDRDLALNAAEAFAEGFVRAIPTGKQNSFAAHNPPAFVGISVRRASPFNLANAFELPLHASREVSLTQASVRALGETAQRIGQRYGDERDVWGVLDDTRYWPKDCGSAHANLRQLIDWLRAEVERRLPAEG